MNGNRASQSVFARGIELQAEINELAADYAAEMARQAAQRARFDRLARLIEELRKARRLLDAAGRPLPDLMTAEAEAVQAALVRNGFFSGETTPPEDRAAN